MGRVDRNPCFPLPAKQYTPGSVLAACISLEPTTGQEFRAVFAEAASSLETFSELELREIEERRFHCILMLEMEQKCLSIDRSPVPQHQTV